MSAGTIHSLRIETAALVRDVTRIFEAASDVAHALRDVGIGADDALADVFTDSPAEDLHERATRPASQPAMVVVTVVTASLLTLPSELAQ